MSRAFVKESDEGQALAELPDRPLSPHPNFVTAAGLAQIDAEIARLQKAHEAAKPDDRAGRASIARDLRYWRARRGTAQLMPPPADAGKVQFGSTVSIRRADGRLQTFRIVGEDEADPGRGRLSYVAPLGRALIGKQAGDVVKLGEGEIEIIGIANDVQ